MRILHICLASFYIDNYTYQENMITKYHVLLGHEVEILASLQSFDKNGQAIYLNKAGTYLNENDIKVTRIKYKFGFWNKKLKTYKKPTQIIESYKPDFIFIHGPQFLDLYTVVKEGKKISAKIVLDNHGDFDNSAKNVLSLFILHKILWRFILKISNQYIDHYYGVLPSRVDFLKKLYKLPNEKISLLRLGYDNFLVDSNVFKNKLDDINREFPRKSNEIIIITGGKINSNKIGILNLIKAVDYFNIKLIVFGSLSNDVKESFYEIVKKSKNTFYVSFLDNISSMAFFRYSDIAFFPTLHSTYWEQAAGLGTPLIVKKSRNSSYINLNNNAIIIEDDSLDSIIKGLKTILNNDRLLKLKKNANEVSHMFEYSKIAQSSLDFKKES